MAKIRRALGILPAGVLFAITSNASASIPLGSEQLDVDATTNGYVIPSAHVRTLDLSAPLSFTSSPVTAAASALGLPAVAATANSLIGDYHSNARAALFYYISVNGSDPALTVPVFYSSDLYATAGGNDGNGSNGDESSSASASFFLQEYSGNPEAVPNSFVEQPFGQTLLAQTRTNSSPILDPVYIGDFVNVPTGYYLLASISASATSRDGGNAQASANSYFYIDPSFLTLHPGYSLSFSPFVGNVPLSAAAVPEPSTWALMILGFGGIGFAMRRQRKSATTALA